MIRQEPRKGSQCRGSIINITSLAGHGGAYAQLPAYTMSKACPESLTRSIAQETGAQGIRINTVAPGFTLTPMLQGHAAQETLDQIATLVPMRRLGTSQDIANACLLLSSPYAEYIHGQSLAVDGGLSLEHYC